VVHYKNGDKYNGEWKHNKRKGKGTNYYVNGDVCKGEFKQNKKDGYRIYQYKNENKYEGEFNEDTIKIYTTIEENLVMRIEKCMKVSIRVIRNKTEVFTTTIKKSVKKSGKMIRDME
jgi:hypothetical protein